MSSTKVQRPVKVDNPEERMVQKRKELHRRATFNAANNVPKKHKHENDGRKFGRKRTLNFPPGYKLFTQHKRRKKEEQLTLPTKFLLGGNIYDPLNLNSLQDEAINREMNAFTPKSSPVPTPKHRKGEIELIIPPNLNDPLQLTSCDNDADYEQQLISPAKKTGGRRPRSNRSKKKRNSSSGCSTKENATAQEGGPAEGEAVGAVEEVALPTLDTATTSTEVSAPARMETASRNLDLPLKKDPAPSKDKGGGKFRAKFDSKDKIVSPVIPQSRPYARPYNHRPGNKHNKEPAQPPVFKPRNAYYQYGNYNRYYGYRNPNHEADARLKCFAERRAMFVDKDVLDIGCNIGHVSLCIARDLGARSVVGLDIDKQLINIARKNIRHYVNCKDSPVNDSAPGSSLASRNKFFPISMPIVFGPVDLPGVSESPSARTKFPENVTFVEGNYVLDSDALLETEQPQFDVILCLSITKWLHLNWGDAGLKQAFRRMYVQLRPGGKLILEAQSWDSYKKRRGLTETTYKNYLSIQFFPQKFTQYLLSEVGFHKCEVLDIPVHPSKGFQRPIQMFHKGSFSSSYSASDCNTPYYTSMPCGWKAPVYTSVVVSTREPDEDETFIGNLDDLGSPVLEASESPVLVASASPVLQESESPVPEATECPMIEVSASPVLEALESSVLGTSQSPVLEVSERPVLEASECPVLEASENSVLEAPESPILELPGSPAVRGSSDLDDDSMPSLIPLDELDYEVTYVDVEENSIDLTPCSG